MTIIVCGMDDTGLMMYMYMYVCECIHVSDDTDLIMYMHGNIFTVRINTCALM